jgi:hypothetical protein
LLEKWTGGQKRANGDSENWIENLSNNGSGSKISLVVKEVRIKISYVGAAEAEMNISIKPIAAAFTGAR